MTESIQIWNSASIPRVVQKCRALTPGDQCIVSITKSPIHPLARVVDASQPISAIDLVGRLQGELPAPSFLVELVDPTHVSIRRS